MDLSCFGQQGPLQSPLGGNHTWCGLWEGSWGCHRPSPVLGPPSLLRRVPTTWDSQHTPWVASYQCSSVTCGPRWVCLPAWTLTTLCSATRGPRLSAQPLPHLCPLAPQGSMNQSTVVQSGAQAMVVSLEAGHGGSGQACGDPSRPWSRVLGTTAGGRSRLASGVGASLVPVGRQDSIMWDRLGHTVRN